MNTNRSFLRILTQISFVISIAIISSITHATNNDVVSDTERSETLVIGKISTNPKKHYPYLKPMVKYAVERMGDLGIKNHKILMAKDLDQLVTYMREGRIDWITDTPFVSSVLEEKAGANILLLKHKKGVREYKTVFFTRKDSGIRSLSDLKGKKLVLQDRSSTSAFAIPISILINAGLDVQEVNLNEDVESLDKVCYLLTLEEITMSTWVHKGIVDAGAYSDGDWAKDDQLPESFRKDMLIFHRSKAYPRGFEVVRKGLSPALVTRLKSLLLNAHKDPAAAKALVAYQRTTRFEEIDDVMQEALREIGQIKKLIQAIPE